MGFLFRSKEPVYSIPQRDAFPFLERIAQIIDSDKSFPKKHRHTTKRIYERIQEEGYQGKYTQVKEAVRELQHTKREVFMPLINRTSEAQVEFGNALAKVSGVQKKNAFFVMALPYSDAFFVMAFERECSESYWEGHLRAFEFFGSVPQCISYDNAKVLVSKVISFHERRLTDGFLKLQSQYLFREHFCRAARANEKGVVEGVVKYDRLNFLVPVPQVEDLTKLNARLVEMCRQDMKRRLRRKTATKAQLLKEDQAAFLSLPATTYQISVSAALTGTPQGTNFGSGSIRFLSLPFTVNVLCPDNAPEGCSHGYWKNHTSEWQGYDPTQTVGSVFYLPDSLNTLGSHTLIEALNYGGGNTLLDAAKILLRNAVAAILNAEDAGVYYPKTVEEIIDDVDAALSSENRTSILGLEAALDGYNNLGCPLGVE